MRYFTDENKEIVNPDLFTTEAENLAKRFAEIEHYNQDNRGRPKIRENHKSQIRKFFDDTLRYRTLIESAEDIDKEFRRQLPYIRMMAAKASYSLSRDKITNEFKKFLEDNLNNLEDFRDFKVFCELFEAIVAYSTQYLKKD